MCLGGINLQNIAQYIEADIEGIVTTAPYYAKPLDIKVSSHINFAYTLFATLRKPKVD